MSVNAVLASYPVFQSNTQGTSPPRMARLYITLDGFANRQVNEIDTVVRLSGGAGQSFR